ncbi:MAG: ABC transporter substrate-binding protein, partial [Acidobacteriales bacterium]|nr:ABC transporter substrate-binding protein [Terriglobales bacterium]
LELVIACTKYCVDLCPEVERFSPMIVEDSWTAQAEQIRAAHPELVIAAVPFQQQAVAEILKSGARFLGFAPRTLADIYTDIAILAGAVGAEAQGSKVISMMQRAIADVRTATRTLPRRCVHCEEWGKPILLSQPWVAELVEAAGGEFVGSPAARLDAEAVAATNPEVIVAAWCGVGDRAPLQKIVTDRGWENLAAVQHQRVFAIRDDFLNTPAPTLIYGLQALAAAIHPEKFSSAQGLRSMSPAGSMNYV